MRLGRSAIGLWGASLPARAAVRWTVAGLFDYRFARYDLDYLLTSRCRMAPDGVAVATGGFSGRGLGS